MTKAQTIDAIRALGLVARWSTEWQEWTVNYALSDPRRSAASAYHTPDNDDALDTAKAMAAYERKA